MSYKDSNALAASVGAYFHAKPKHKPKTPASPTTIANVAATAAPQHLNSLADSERYTALASAPTVTKSTTSNAKPSASAETGMMVFSNIDWGAIAGNALGSALGNIGLGGGGGQAPASSYPSFGGPMPSQSFGGMSKETMLILGGAVALVLVVVLVKR